MQENGKNNRLFHALIFVTILTYTLLFSYINLRWQSKKFLSNQIGFGMSTKADPVYWANELNASWYLDWKTTPISSVAKPEYWQMIRLSKNGTHPSIDEIVMLVSNFPGHVWIIGNEPDNIWQDNLDYSQFTRFYHDLYYLIKSYDPSAQIAIGAISQPTPLRLKYLDLVMTEYLKLYGHKLPMDWWTIHAYVLREEKNSWGADIPPGFEEKFGELYEIQDHNNPIIFQQNITNFRKWMSDNGYQNKPLAITEFGILLPQELGFTPEIVANYLSSSFDWLYTTKDSELGYPADDFHLVQKFAWFSLGDKIYPVADLADFNNMKLSLIGEKFKESSHLLTK